MGCGYSTGRYNHDGGWLAADDGLPVLQIAKPVPKQPYNQKPPPSTCPHLKDLILICPF